ncbi:MAG: ABC transporter ATP-binding protein [Candidatus Pacearchaeota archaeon]
MARNGKLKKVEYKKNLKEYLSFLKNYKLLAAILLVIVLFHESKLIVERYLFKIVIDQGTGFVVGSVQTPAYISILLWVAAVFIIFAVLGTAANWAKLHLLNRLDAHTIFDLKQKYFAHILHLDHNFHTTHKTGSLISRLGRGAGSIERMNDSVIFEIAPLILQTIVAVIALLYLDKLQAFLIVGTMAVFLTFSLVMQRATEKENLKFNKTEDIEKGNMADFFTNIDSIRYFGKEDLIKNRYRSLSRTTKKAALRFWDYFRTVSAGQALILAVGTFLLLFFSIKSFIAGQITLGTVSFIYATYGGLIGPLFSFVHGVRNLSRSLTDFQDLFAYGDIKSEISDVPGAKPIVITDGEIEFNHIDFAYKEKKKLFKDFSLKIPPKKKVALVGHSGCGKTTLIKLLYRLYDVDGGEILVDGQNIKGVSQMSLRSEMSIVPQECILFDDSLYNNIRFSNPKASRKEVMNAIKFAQLDKFIKTLPKKENTIVGERGVKLSGGEKQRVSIARALLANKRVLVLDEATSALDSKTEWEIKKDLEKLMKGRTSIIIAHRLSTIMNADLIVVMKEGKIEQIGTHRELITEGGEYQRLWDFQSGGYITEKFEHEPKEEKEEREE